MGGVGVVDCNCHPESVFSTLCLELQLDVVGEKVGQNIANESFDHAVYGKQNLCSDVGDAFGHPRRKNVPVGDVEATEEIPILCTRRFVVAA